MADVPVRLADDVDDVIAVLDDVVGWAQDQASALGYFAVLYRDVTAKVRDGIDDGFFDDGERMARLDVVFANRYLAALDALRRGAPATQSWQLGFDAASAGGPIVLQHLLVGISAHINLDLAIAVVEAAGSDGVTALRRDFDRINAILASMMARSQAALATISPWLGALDAFGGRTDDAVVRFSIEVARRQAWTFATQLGGLPASEVPGAITARDVGVVPVGRTVLRPGWLTPVVWIVRLRESKDVHANLDALSVVQPPDLAEVEAIADGRTPLLDP